MKKIGKFFNSLGMGLISCLAFILLLVLFIPVNLLFPTKIEGLKNLRKTKKGAVIACNHFSNFDVIYLSIRLFLFVPKRKFLAKKELNKNWFVGFLIRACGAIFISRGALDKTAVREVNDALKSGKKVIVFPEGTRNKTESDDMQEIKSGVVFFAKRANVPIIPMRFIHRMKIFRKNKICIGKPYLVGENGKLSTAEEVGILENKFNELVEV